MPEITSAENIRSKLQQFDERVDGAIEAAVRIAHVREKADAFLSEVDALSQKARAALSDATTAAQRLGEVERSFEQIKAQAESAQAELKETRARVAQEFEAALRAIGDRLATAEERLQAESRETLSQQAEYAKQDFLRLQSEAEVLRARLEETHARIESELTSAVGLISEKVHAAKDELRQSTADALSQQAELLTRLDESTSVAARRAEVAASQVDARTTRVEELLVTARNELTERAESELLSVQQSVHSQLEAIQVKAESLVHSTIASLHAESDKASQALAERAAANEMRLKQEIASFKSEMTASISEQRQSIDRQITDFLNKQSALVQNLTQQIESYSGVASAMSAELATMRTQLAQLASYTKGIARRLGEQDEKQKALTEQLANVVEKLSKKSWLPWTK